MTLEHSAGAVIYRKRANKLEYLILQGIKDKRWGFAKGHLEGTEDPEQAAKREVKEEAGLKPIFDFNFKRQIKYMLPNKNEKELTLFVAQAVKEEKVSLQKSEIVAGKWVTLSEAVKYLTEHGKMKVLEAAEDYLRNND